MFRLVATVLVAIIAVAAFGSLSGPPKTLAHEHRTVLENYEFVVGWLNEPALANEPNALSLRITHFPNGVPEEESEHEGAESSPVEGLEGTLQAEIIAGGGAETKELILEPAFEDPGQYQSVVIPTVPGDYTFRIFGDLEGQQIDESFSSGPETFSVIEDPAEVQFPQTPSANNGATSSESSGGSDDTARALGIIGIIAGVIGGGIGGLAIATRRS